MPGLHLDVIGGGWWEERLVDHAALLGISDAVTFHGHVDDDAKHEVLQRSWVHVLPSRKEGWGLAVTEAASTRCRPSATGSSGGLTDSIVDGVTGLLVDDHERVWSTALERLLTDGCCATSSAPRPRCAAGVLLAAERRCHAHRAGVGARRAVVSGVV